MLTEKGMTRLDGTGTLHLLSGPLLERVVLQLNEINSLEIKASDGTLNIEKTNKFRQNRGEENLPSEITCNGLVYERHCLTDNGFVQFRYEPRYT